MKWESSANYSRDDLHSMQQDAIQRVRDMQRRSDLALQTAQRSPSFFSNPATPRPSSSHNAQRNAASERRSSPQSPRENVENLSPSVDPVSVPHLEPVQKSVPFSQPEAVPAPFALPLLGKDTLHQVIKVLNLDNERLLILLLLFVLYNEGADYTLMFALLYLFI